MDGWRRFVRRMDLAKSRAPVERGRPDPAVGGFSAAVYARSTALGISTSRPAASPRSAPAAGFEGAPEWITVSPNIGKLERKGGEATILTVSANPPKGTEFEEDLGLVCVLPDDIDKAYKIAVKVGANVVTKEFDAGSDEELD